MIFSDKVNSSKTTYLLIEMTFIKLIKIIEIIYLCGMTGKV